MKAIPSSETNMEQPTTTSTSHSHSGSPTIGEPMTLRTDTAIEMQNLSAWYSKNQVLHAIDLDIAAKQVCAFIGPSGCGKSTLLRWLNRMNDTIPGARATGKIALHGVSLLDTALDVVDLRRRVGMVFQKPNHKFAITTS